MGNTIQAKMSDRAARAAHMNGLAAEREARAILAETEPAADGYSATVVAWGCKANQTTTLRAFDSLADALRSFLGCDQHVAMGERS